MWETTKNYVREATWQKGPGILANLLFLHSKLLQNSVCKTIILLSLWFLWVSISNWGTRGTACVLQDGRASTGDTQHLEARIIHRHLQSHAWWMLQWLMQCLCYLQERKAVGNTARKFQGCKNHHRSSLDHHMALADLIKLSCTHFFVSPSQDEYMSRNKNHHLSHYYGGCL